jgi:hypothetical protein
MEDPKDMEDRKMMRRKTRFGSLEHYEKGGVEVITVFALEQQWRTKPELKALQQAGANRVILWLLRHDLKSILDELEELARKVLG